MLAGTACGATADPAALLRSAKQEFDAARTAHFTLTSSSVQGGGPFITGGSGDMQRPSSFTGSLDVDVSGLQLSVKVLSVGGVFYAQLPNSSSLQPTNPADYGFGDPAELLDPHRGLSNLLVICAHPSLASDDRYNGAELHEVSCSLPGSAIAALLTDAAPSQPVAATFGIDSTTMQLRRVALTGPFFSGAGNTTFTLIVDHYGESVSITPPPTGS